MRGVMAFGKNHMLPRRFVHVGTLRHFAYTEGSFAIDQNARSSREKFLRTSFNVTKLKDNIKEEEEAEPTDFDNTTLVNFRNNQKINILFLSFVPFFTMYVLYVQHGTIEIELSHTCLRRYSAF